MSQLLQLSRSIEVRRLSTDAQWPGDLEGIRPLLLSIAYRMVGSVAEAEDLVQDAYLRYHRTAATDGPVDSPKAYLAKIVTRLSIDHLRSARVRRETYVGTWLPEPLLTGGDDPAEQVATADSLSMAFLVLLQNLSPVERAVFLLHDVLGFGYDEIARVVQKSEDNCRQIAVRSRRAVAAGRPRFDATRRQKEELADRFFAAVGDGDVDELLQLLASDAVMVGDGGGKAPAVRQPVHGRERVARFLAGLGRTLVQVHIRSAEVNGEPGAVVTDLEGRTIVVFSLDILDGTVQTIRAILNPDKLRHLGPVADVARLLQMHAAQRLTDR